MSVIDASGSNNGVKNGSSSYGYDNAGNMTSDNNKGAGIDYNILNLPRQIAVNTKTVQYHYDGTGAKQRMSNGTVNTKYAGGFEYDENNYLTRIATDEGQVAVTAGGNTYTPNYYLKDHLGNVRMVIDGNGTILQETEYFAFGLAIPRSGNDAANKYQFLTREKQPETGYIDLVKRFYDPSVGRFMQVDPVTETQENYSTYQYGWNNPILQSDPNGDCPNCITGLIGAGVGALVGGGIEIAAQLYSTGSVTDWGAVGGSALQGGITGGVAGLTGGASLLATAAASGAANAVGGAVNSAIQGQEITAQSIATDAAVGAVAGAGGRVVGNAVKGSLDNLSNTAKGKLGEAVTQVKYGAQGYKDGGKAVVPTGGKTPTGRDAVARYDHSMRNVVTGKQLTVESKFNTSGYTKNQTAAMQNVKTPGGVIENRSTSQGLGNAAGAATTGASAGAAATRKPDEH